MNQEVLGDPSDIEALRRQFLIIRQEWSSLPWGVTGVQTWKDGGSRTEHPGSRRGCSGPSRAASAEPAAVVSSQWPQAVSWPRLMDSY